LGSRRLCPHHPHHCQRAGALCPGMSLACTALQRQLPRAAAAAWRQATWRRLPADWSQPLPAGRESTSVSAAGRRGFASGQQAALPEHLQRIVDDYDRRQAADESSQGRVERVLRSRFAAPLGACVAGGFMYILYSLDDVTSEVHSVFGWLLSRLDPATAHAIILRLANANWLPKDYEKDDPYLAIEPYEGFRLTTPVGLAPGVDREAAAPNAFMTLGFGLVEVGPVAPGAEGAVGERLAARDATGQLEHLGLVGACIRGPGLEELLRLVVVLGPHVDYLALDLNSLPARVRGREELLPLVTAVVNEAVSLPRAPKVFLRTPAGWPEAQSSTAARLAAAASLASVALSGGVAGLIFCQNGAGHDADAEAEESMRVLSEAYRESRGNLVLVACGGVRTGREALDRIEAGATAVQISQPLLSDGPQVCRRIKNELSQALSSEGYVNLQDAVGAAHRKLRKGRRKNPWRAKGTE